MALSMKFVDADGKEHVITGPELIDAENASSTAELRRLRALLASSDPAVSGPAEAKAEALFQRREELRGYAERWDRLVEAAKRQRRFDLIAAIDALGPETPGQGGAGGGQ